MRRLFGTDGIRGVAGEYPLDRPTIFLIGRSLAHHLSGRGPVRVVVGQDTRESSPWIADAITAGIESAGGRVESAGIVTTPAIAYLARSKKFSAGVVISASHNPWQDNGIKIFAHSGYKLPDALELEIEQEIFTQLEKGAADDVPGPRQPSLPGDHALALLYEQWLAEKAAGVDFSRLKVVVDCANGAASTVAPELFRICKIPSSFIHFSPDGRNINQDCGALHPEVVARQVVEDKADIGICFDGDADRALFADGNGRVVNGDAVLLLAARHRKRLNALPLDTIVATTMSNMGLEAALKVEGIRMLRAPVGDKYVLEQMQKTGASLGGEQSGHIIFSDLATTGDGLLTALQVLSIVAESGQPLAELIADLKTFPQIIRNVRVREKKPIEELADVSQAIRQAESDLGEQGRVVARYSGTEKLFRVMVEAASEEKMRHHAEAIARAMEKTLGA